MEAGEGERGSAGGGSGRKLCEQRLGSWNRRRGKSWPHKYLGDLICSNTHEIRLRILIDKFCENCVKIYVVFHLCKPKLCNVCTSFSQPVNDSPELTRGTPCKPLSEEGKADERAVACVESTALFSSLLHRRIGGRRENAER